jgi:hypothetical protein
LVIWWYDEIIKMGLDFRKRSGKIANGSRLVVEGQVTNGQKVFPNTFNRKSNPYDMTAEQRELLISQNTTPIPSATPSPTPTPTPTFTVTPTITPTNTPTNTPTPTPTSSVSGDFNVIVSQVGPDVVWQGSGSFNLSSLTLGDTNILAGAYDASTGAWGIGPNATVDGYSGITTYPITFGTGGNGTTSNTGSTFGILLGGSEPLLYVPSGYISNTTINGSSIYDNQTISGMGLTPGTYTWSWGTGANTSTLVMIIV